MGPRGKKKSVKGRGGRGIMDSFYRSRCRVISPDLKGQCQKGTDQRKKEEGPRKSKAVGDWHALNLRLIELKYQLKDPNK